MRRDRTRGTADPGRGRRLLLGAALMAAALGADLLLESTLAPPHAATVGRLAWFAFEFVVVIAVCVATNAWSQRRGHGAVGRVVRAVLTAGGTGALLAIASTRALPPLPPPPGHVGMPPIGVLAMLGFVRGVVVCGLWALGFVYPIAVEAERARADDEVARLRSHLEPHFLLNTLNLIAGLVGQDPDEARRLIGCLGDLLADAVEHDEGDASVDDEVAWLRRYADILEARHPGVLRFRFEVSAAARGQRLPRLLLQPLVENAVKHGALGKPGGGTIVVRADVDVSVPELVCSVDDEGRGLGARPPRAGAFGLESVRRRLALERPGATFTLASTTTGTRATVRIPSPKGRRA